MIPHPPPFTALRCFEAAARHESFTLAADELCLTPSAVSHQIRSLEASLGVQLFVRAGRKTLLTTQGSAYFGRIRKAFDEIAEATQEVGARRKGESLKISVAPSFASAWLMPQLARFMRENNDLEVHVFTSRHPVDFADSVIDCEIRYGHGKWLALCSDLLFEEHIVPLCSPVLLGDETALAEPADLLRYTLIYTDGRQVSWDTWAQRHRVMGLQDAQSLHVDRSPLALEAAIAGLGIALESDVLASRDIRQGKLIAPFGVESGSDEAYYLVCPKSNERLERVRAFRTWILDASRSMRQERGDARRPVVVQASPALRPRLVKG